MKTKGSVWGFLKFFLTVVLIVVGIVFLVVALFPEPKAKDYGCSEYSLECELEKDYIVLLPLTYDSTLVDVFGKKIDTSIHQWYVLGKKSHVLVPTIFSVYEGGTVDCPIHDNYPSVEKILQKINGVKIDTTDISFFVPGLTSCAVVVSGPNEIVVFSNTQASLVRKQ